MANDTIATIAEQWKHEHTDPNSSPIYVVGRILRTPDVPDGRPRPLLAAGLGNGDFDVLAGGPNDRQRKERQRWRPIHGVTTSGK